MVTVQGFMGGALGLELSFRRLQRSRVVKWFIKVGPWRSGEGMRVGHAPSPQFAMSREQGRQSCLITGLLHCPTSFLQHPCFPQP